MQGASVKTEAPFLPLPPTLGISYGVGEKVLNTDIRPKIPYCSRKKKPHPNVVQANNS